MSVESIVEDQVESIKERDYVKAVAVVGSYARDPGSSHNDIDIFVVVEEDEKGDWRMRETEVVETGDSEVVVERFFNSMEWSRKYLEGDGWWYNYWWYTNADVRYDPENLFDDLREYAEKQREKMLELSEDERELVLYGIWDQRRDVESSEDAQRIYVMDQFFDFLVRKYYRVRGEIPVKDNYRIKRLEEIDAEMHRLATEYLKSSNPEKKEELLGWIVEEVVVNVEGEPGPEFGTSKEYLD